MSIIRQNFNAQYIGLIQSPQLDPSLVGNVSNVMTMIMPKSSLPPKPPSSNGAITPGMKESTGIIVPVNPQIINRET